MKTLIWHWGRRGAGPIFAAALAQALARLPGQQAVLSLPAAAELLSAPGAPPCAWREPTYKGSLGYFRARLLSPVLAGRTVQQLRRLAPDMAICAMPALLDGRMLAGLTRLGLPYGVIVHDATAHPGDLLRFRVLDQHHSLRGARHLFCLSGHVEEALRAQGYGSNGQSLTRLWHPPLDLVPGLAPVPAMARPRLLHFGRLLPYKGLDLLADALALLGPERGFELRICGEGPASPSLKRLAGMAGVQVENRWFSDAELPALLGWAGGVVLPYREASQSGVAALALAAGRQVLATNVGGLAEQLGGQTGALLCAPQAPAVAAGLQALLARLRAPVPAAAVAHEPAGWDGFAAALLAALEA